MVACQWICFSVAYQYVYGPFVLYRDQVWLAGTCMCVVCDRVLGFGQCLYTRDNIVMVRLSHLELGISPLFLSGI